MKERTLNMTTGSPMPLILSFALPLMLGNVFQQLYTVVDTAVVGRALGVGALAALGASDWLNWLMLGMVQGLTQGFGIRMAQNYGAGNQRELCRTIGASAVLSAGGALLLLTAGQLGVLPALRALRTPESILPDAALYLRILFGGVPIVMAYNFFATILRSLGDGRTPLKAMVTASLLNIGLDLLFVLVFRWGIAGAAAATLLAQVCAAAFCLLRLLKVPGLALERSDFRPDGMLVKRLLVLGSPMALQNAIIAFGGMILQSVVNGYGVIFIGGFTATNKLYGLLEIAATSYGYAMITYAGQNLGAGKIRRIRQGQRAALAISMITSGIIAAAMIFFGRSVVGIFLSGSPQEVAAATEVAYEYLVIMSVFLPVLYVLHVTRSAIQGVGNTVLPMVSGISEFFMRTGGAMLLPLVMGASGVFYAEVLAWVGADLILIPSYFYVLKKCEKYQL